MMRRSVLVGVETGRQKGRFIKHNNQKELHIAIPMPVLHTKEACLSNASLARHFGLLPRVLCDARRRSDGSRLLVEVAVVTLGPKECLELASPAVVVD